MRSKCGPTCLSLLLVAITSSIAAGAGPEAASPPLKFVDSFKHGPFGGVTQVFITPGGRTCLCDAVYATATFSGRIACFDRDAATGRLCPRGSVEHLRPGQRILGPMGLAVHPNSRFVYIACSLEGSIAIFEIR